MSASISGGASAVRIAKMPKLVISKFEGTPQEWVTFSGQFSSQIDGTSEPATTETYRWITFHQRGLPQSQSSAQEKIWPN